MTMEHRQYIARKRARIDGIGGPVNIPYGSTLEVQDGFLIWQGAAVCTTTSQNAHDYFTQNDDGKGKERGALLEAITRALAPRDHDPRPLDRWKKIWADQRCQKYKRPEHQDHWLWNNDFFNAPVEDLGYIARLIGAKV